MKVDRLLKLAKLLRSKEVKDHFDMTIWGNHKFCETVAQGKENPCTASACAFGWACSIPEFRQAGLKMQLGMYIHPNICFRGKLDEEAAALFFGITYSKAIHLFMPSSYKDSDDLEPITPLEVAERIEEMVKEYKPRKAKHGKPAKKKAKK